MGAGASGLGETHICLSVYLHLAKVQQGPQTLIAAQAKESTNHSMQTKMGPHRLQVPRIHTRGGDQVRGVTNFLCQSISRYICNPGPADQLAGPLNPTRLLVYSS